MSVSDWQECEPLKEPSGEVVFAASLLQCADGEEQRDQAKEKEQKAVVGVNVDVNDDDDDVDVQSASALYHSSENPFEAFVQRARELWHDDEIEKSNTPD
jgi:hypothetical protein